MRYPDDFDTSSFPAGKQISVSRAIGIATMVVFLLIIFACVFLLWAQKSAHVHPFLVSINNITGRWEIVGHHHSDTKEITTTQALQESVIGKFLEYRFWITDDAVFNDNIWQTCDRTKDCNPENKKGLSAQVCHEMGLDSETCATIDMKTETCALYCLSGNNLHSDFVSDIVPTFQAYAQAGDTWVPDMSSVHMLPIGKITETGGVWQIRMTINSKLYGAIHVLAYANVLRSLDFYPKTLGYYVAEFNAYKINK
ncbi:MAG: VirB8/TrbF family protein [Alphaproteobacteria bacterium]